MGKFETQIRPLTLLLQAPAASERSRLVDRSTGARRVFRIGGPGFSALTVAAKYRGRRRKARINASALHGVPPWVIRIGRRGSDTDVVDERVGSSVTDAAFPFLRISPRPRTKILSFYTSLLVHASLLMPRCTPTVRRFTEKTESYSFTCQIGFPVCY